MFDPALIPDDSVVEGHLDVDPVYDVLVGIQQARSTGRLTVEDAAGPNHMFFLDGRPVGVALSEYVHPLGQLLLELGRINGQTFVRAQRRIAEGNRLAGQVFKELGVLDESSLTEVLAIQARKKAEHFCRLGSRAFSFARGRVYLNGFTSTPLDISVVVYLAVRAQLGPDARAKWIDQARDLQVRIQNAPGDETGLPAPPHAFGFGVAEERFLQRIVGGWEKVAELCDTGTLPKEEAAVLLRFLEVIGRLDKRQAPTAVPAGISALIKQPKEIAALAVPEGLDDVFSSSGPAEKQGSALPKAPPVARAQAAAPQPAAQAVAQRAPASPESVFAGAEERTDPRRQSIYDQQTVPLGDLPPLGDPLAGAPSLPVGGPVGGPNDPLGDPILDPLEAPAFASSSSSPSNAATHPDRPRFRSVLFPEPEQNAPPPPSMIVSEELPAPVVKKKKVKRTEPLPSEGAGLKVSETRKEKTNVGPMPSIVIDEE